LQTDPLGFCICKQQSLQSTEKRDYNKFNAICPKANTSPGVEIKSKCRQLSKAEKIGNENKKGTQAYHLIGKH